MSQINTYLGNPDLKNVKVNLDFTADQVSEIVRCSEDVVYFTETYIKIIHVDRGIVPFIPYDFQRQLLKIYQNNRFVIAKIARQSGKSITTIAYLLWYLLFNENVNVALLANKGNTARELLSRLQLAYMSLPKWMQQGIVVWNKGSIELENGSKIIATATSSSAIRGQSYNIIFLDEFAHIDSGMAEDFFRSSYPTISSGKTTKVFIVSTPKGLNLFYKLWSEATKKPGEKTSKFIPFEVNYDQVPGRDAEWRDQEIANLGSQEAFDQEYGTEFLGSSETLISGTKLRLLSFNRPMSSQNGLDVYQDPIVDTITDDAGLTIRSPHKYVLCCDTAQGKQLDYSAFVVIDVTEVPYKLVAKYRSNIVSTILFPDIIYDIARKYNNAHVLIEINDGRDVANTLQFELEYENILTCTTKGRAGQILSPGFNKNPQFGLKMTPPVKKLGCANLKTLVETDKLVFVDFDIISELSTFISQGNGKYAADEDSGAHDDLVMCLVIFAWLIQQKYFKELNDSDLRSRMLDEFESQMEHDMVPFGFIVLGNEDLEPEVASGDVWYPVNTIVNW